MTRGFKAIVSPCCVLASVYGINSILLVEQLFLFSLSPLLPCLYSMLGYSLKQLVVSESCYPSCMLLHFSVFGLLEMSVYISIHVDDESG